MFNESNLCKSRKYCALCRSGSSNGEQFRERAKQAFGWDTLFSCPLNLAIGEDIPTSVVPLVLREGSGDKKGCCGK